jgi:hypothetical protein
MDIGEYLLDREGLDWSRLLEHWDHLLPDELTVWFANRFGEPILVFEDGSVLQRLADSREAFASAIDEGQNAQHWLRISEVDRAVAGGIRLEPRQCYGYGVPVILQGEYTLENTRVLQVEEQYAFLADLHHQIRDLPDGTQIRLRPR